MATKENAVALLKADHRKVEELFESFKKARSEDRKVVLVREICTELMVHATIEEEIFYPACKGRIEDEDLLDEAPSIFISLLLRITVACAAESL